LRGSVIPHRTAWVDEVVLLHIRYRRGELRFTAR
jgi:hypothetical protein